METVLEKATFPFVGMKVEFKEQYQNFIGGEWVAPVQEEGYIAVGYIRQGSVKTPYIVRVNQAGEAVFTQTFIPKKGQKSIMNRRFVCCCCNPRRTPLHG